MKEILIICRTLEASKNYFNDYIEPIFNPFKKINGFYTSKNARIKLASLNNIEFIRGMRLDYIYIDNNSTLDEYNMLLQLLYHHKNPHSRIRVVM